MSRAAASALKLRQSLFLSAVLKSSQERKASATLFSVISVIPRSPAASAIAEQSFENTSDPVSGALSPER